MHILAILIARVQLPRRNAAHAAEVSLALSDSLSQTQSGPETMIELPTKIVRHSNVNVDNQALRVLFLVLRYHPANPKAPIAETSVAIKKGSFISTNSR